MTASDYPKLAPFWTWNTTNGGGMSEALMRLVEKETKKAAFNKGVIGVHAADSAVNETVRVSDIHFLPSLHWMAGVMFNYAAHANASAQWNMTLTAPETVQMTRYGAGGFYNFHTDAEPVSSMPYVRRVSVVCCLSPSSDYEGGEFEFMDGGKVRLERGDIIVFPSLAPHRVCPITAGERRSMVSWILGPNMR